MAAANDELTGLAATAATSMVSAMGTDLWPAVKHSVLRLLSRLPGRRADLAAALEQHEGAETALADDAVRARFVQFWAGALEALIRQEPALLPELADLAAVAAGGAAPRSGYQRNTAHGSGTVYANQYGSQFINHSSPREPQ